MLPSSLLSVPFPLPSDTLVLIQSFPNNIITHRNHRNPSFRTHFKTHRNHHPQKSSFFGFRRCPYENLGDVLHWTKRCFSLSEVWKSKNLFFTSKIRILLHRNGKGSWKRKKTYQRVFSGNIEFELPTTSLKTHRNHHPQKSSFSEKGQLKCKYHRWF